MLLLIYLFFAYNVFLDSFWLSLRLGNILASRLPDHLAIKEKVEWSFRKRVTWRCQGQIIDVISRMAARVPVTGCLVVTSIPEFRFKGKNQMFFSLKGALTWMKSDVMQDNVTYKERQRSVRGHWRSARDKVTYTAVFFLFKFERWYFYHPKAKVRKASRQPSSNFSPFTLSNNS